MFALCGLFHCPFHFLHAGTPFNLVSEVLQPPGAPEPTFLSPLQNNVFQAPCLGNWSALCSQPQNVYTSFWKWTFSTVPPSHLSFSTDVRHFTLAGGRQGCVLCLLHCGRTQGAVPDTWLHLLNNDWADDQMAEGKLLDFLRPFLSTVFLNFNNCFLEKNLDGAFKAAWVGLVQ